MDDSFPPRLTGGELLKKEILLENNGILSIIPWTLHYFEPVQLMSSLLRDPDIMEHFVCHT
jgi:hypothetical protein